MEIRVQQLKSYSWSYSLLISSLLFSLFFISSILIWWTFLYVPFLCLFCPIFWEMIKLSLIFAIMFLISNSLSFLLWMFFIVKMKYLISHKCWLVVVFSGYLFLSLSLSLALSLTLFFFFHVIVFLHKSNNLLIFELGNSPDRWLEILGLSDWISMRPLLSNPDINIDFCPSV